MKKKILYFILVAIFTSCCSVKNNTAKSLKIVDEVSIISLISNPKLYHNKRVSVKGYFIIQKEEHVIYFSKADYEAAIYKNGIWLSLSKSETIDLGINEPFKGYVIIEGTFNKNKLGSFNLFSGAIENITLAERMYKRGSLIDEFNMN